MLLNVPVANWAIKEGEFCHLIFTMFAKISTCWMKHTLILAQSHTHSAPKKTLCYQINQHKYSLMYIFVFSQSCPFCSTSMQWFNFALISPKRPHAVRFTGIKKSLREFPPWYNRLRIPNSSSTGCYRGVGWIPGQVQWVKGSGCIAPAVASIPSVKGVAVKWKKKKKKREILGIHFFPFAPPLCLTSHIFLCDNLILPWSRTFLPLKFRYIPPSYLQVVSFISYRLWPWMAALISQSLPLLSPLFHYLSENSSQNFSPLLMGKGKKYILDLDTKS